MKKGAAMRAGRSWAAKVEEFLSLSLLVLVAVLLISAYAQATSDCVPGELIVRFKPGAVHLPEGRRGAAVEEATVVSPLDSLLMTSRVDSLVRVFSAISPGDSLREVAGVSIRIQGLVDTYRLFVPAATDIYALATTFAGSKGVVYAEPNYTSTIQDRNPYDLAGLWNLKQASDVDTDAPGGWEISTGSSSVRIGIYDTGIDYSHPDMGNAYFVKVVGGHDFVSGDNDPMDDNYHGTHVAGIAGALTGNLPMPEESYVGVAGGWGFNSYTHQGNPGAALIAMKVLDANGNGNVARYADAIQQGADPNGPYRTEVINMSYGGHPYSAVEADAVNFALRMGCVLVASKGNLNTTDYNFPSDYTHNWIISVGASNEIDLRAQYPGGTGTCAWGLGLGSNIGHGIDVVAPGECIISCTPLIATAAMNAIFPPIRAVGAALSGTSMAAPHVSGLAALLRSLDPSLSPEDVCGIIRLSADDIQAPGYDDETGAGRINIRRALEFAQAPWTRQYCTATGGAAGASQNLGLYALNNPGDGPLPSDLYYLRSHEVTRTVTFPSGPSKTFVWPRGLNDSGGMGTTGWAPGGQCGVAALHL